MSEAERPDWALRGAQGRPNRTLTSLNLTPEGLEQTNLRLQARLNEVQRNELRWEETLTEDADLLLVAFGTVGRICKTALRTARRNGLKVGLLRPISLWPFPEQRLLELAQQVQQILVVEMNAGQMLLDVRAAVQGRAPIQFYGRMGGMVPLPDEINQQIDRLLAPPGISETGNGYHRQAAAAAVAGRAGV